MILHQGAAVAFLSRACEVQRGVLILFLSLCLFTLQGNRRVDLHHNALE